MESELIDEITELTADEAKCPVDHQAMAAAAAAAPTFDAESCPVTVPAPAAATCPIPAFSKASDDAPGVCPFPHGAAPDGVQRSKADLIVRKLLRIHERPAGVSEHSAYKAFEKSMMISATRCTLTYVVFPFALPALSFAKGVGVLIGIVIGVVAMVADVFTIRRFFAIDHKWRWRFTTAALAVITLLTVLLVQDVMNLAG